MDVVYQAGAQCANNIQTEIIALVRYGKKVHLKDLGFGMFGGVSDMSLNLFSSPPSPLLSCRMKPELDYGFFIYKREV